MAFLSQNALFPGLRMAGLASAFLALVFVVNNFLIFGIDAPGVINTLRLGDIFGVSRPTEGYNISQVLLGIVQTGVVVVIPTLFMGSLIMESFFSIPGLGSYTIEAIQQQDFDVVRVMVFIGT